MNQSFYGSICITDILEKLKMKHSAFSKGKNGKIYMNTTVWLNEQTDDYGNIMSIQSNPGKDSRDQKFYIGNMKKSDSGQKPLTDKDLTNISVPNDLPVKGETKESFMEAADNTQDQLPF